MRTRADVCARLRAMPRRKRLALTLYATLALATTAVVLGLWAFDVFRGSDLETVDVRFAVRGGHEAPDVVLVAIDTRVAHGDRARSRSAATHHARVIRQLTQAGRRRSSTTSSSPSPATTPAADNALVEAVDAAPRIVLGTSEIGESGATNVLGGDDFLEGARRAGRAA